MQYLFGEVEMLRQELETAKNTIQDLLHEKERAIGKYLTLFGGYVAGVHSSMAPELADRLKEFSNLYEIKPVAPTEQEMLELIAKGEELHGGYSG